MKDRKKKKSGVQRLAGALEHAHTMEEVRKRYKEEFHVKTDVAADIAHAVFVGNQEAIYQAFKGQMLKGDAKVFSALANRAYGVKSVEPGVSTPRPLKMTIEVIGGNGNLPKPEIKGELAAPKEEPNAETPQG